MTLLAFHIHFPAWDTALFLRLNGLHTPFWDAVMSFCTNLWNSLPVYLWMAWAFVRGLRRAGLLAVVFALLCFAAGDLLGAEIIKPMFSRLRPTHAPALDGLIHVVTDVGGRYGFVSIHAVTTFSLALFATLVLGRRHPLSWFVWPWAALLSYSRIYVGKHYPLDVLAGTLAGLVLAVVFWLMWKRCVASCPFTNRKNLVSEKE
ncbi:MAG: phosphatase PAP2 family protein [Bacteroidales bacterium]|nr:phosphatase PAP2 family protein [Bacteroidales bacterium]